MLLWDILPTSVPEFRALSTVGGCFAVQEESTSRLGNIALDEVIDQSRVGEVRQHSLLLEPLSFLVSLALTTPGTSPRRTVSRTGSRTGAAGPARAGRGGRRRRGQAHSEGRRSHRRLAPQSQARGDRDA